MVRRQDLPPVFFSRADLTTLRPPRGNQLLKPKYSWRRHIEPSCHPTAESFRQGRRVAFGVLVQLPKPMQEGRWIVIRLGHCSSGIAIEETAYHLASYKTDIR